MASGNMKDIKRRIKCGTVHHADHQGDGAGRVLQAAPREGACAQAQDRTSMPCTRRLQHLAGATRGSESVYTRPREVKNSLYIVIAGDRGLAGGYNANLFKLAAAEMQGKQAQVITIGKKAQEHYAKRPVTVAADYPGIAENHADQ